MAKLEQRKLPKSTTGKPAHFRDMSTRKNNDVEKIKRERERRHRVRDLARKLREDVQQEEKRVRESRKANAQRKVDNEKKSMVIQEIKNIKAMKKLSPKHRHKAKIFLKHEL
jgi:rRNA-processing protein CGR1